MPARLIRNLLFIAVVAAVGPTTVSAQEGGPDIPGEQNGGAYAGVNGKDPSLVAIVSTPGGGSTGAGATGISNAGAAPARGGGSGSSFDCSANAVGLDAEVAAVAAAVNARSNPAPADPNIVTDIIQGPGPNPVIEQPWFREIGGVPHLQYRFTCSGGNLSYDDWVAVVAQGATFVPQPQPEDLLPELYERVVQQLPTPVPRIAPAEWIPQQWTYVHVPTFFWVDQSQGQWAPVVASASVPGLTVTAQAVPERLVVHPGDGGGDVSCEGAPPAFVRGRDDPETFQGCEYAYRDSSAMAPNGESYPVTVDVVWHASWTASNGESGDLGFVSTTSETRMLPVAEIQALVTDG